MTPILHRTLFPLPFTSSTISNSASILTKIYSPQTQTSSWSKQESFLSNSIRIVSGPKIHGLFGALGLSITSQNPDQNRLCRILEKKLGGLTQTVGHLTITRSRESLTCSTLLSNQTTLPKILSTLKQHLISDSHPEELVRIRKSMVEDQTRILENPEHLLVELAHHCMFGHDHQLGSTALDIPTMDLDWIKQTRSKLFVPNNLLLGGIGIDPSFLHSEAESTFGTLSPSPNSSEPSIGSEYHPYYGGSMYVEDSSLLSMHPTLSTENRYKNHVYFFLGFPCAPRWHRDVFPLAIASSLLGGGSSFSAGGPGKGLFSRFYSNILCRHYFVESINVVGKHYGNAGYFGILGSCDSRFVNKTLDLIVNELHKLANSVDSAELEQARNRTISNVLMNTESGITQIESLMRPFEPSINDTVHALRHIQAADIKRTLQRLVSAPIKPTLVVLGSALPNVPDYERLVQKLVIEHQT